MEAFRRAGIDVTDEETRAPMGLLKRDHIRTMLRIPRIAQLWKEKYGREANRMMLSTCMPILSQP